MDNLDYDQFVCIIHKINANTMQPPITVIINYLCQSFYSTCRMRLVPSNNKTILHTLQISYKAVT